VCTVFLGTSGFAAAVLERLAQSEAHRPSLVLTRPDRPSGRGRHMRTPPVAERARALGLPVEQPENVNDPGAAALIARAGGPTSNRGANPTGLSPTTGPTASTGSSPTGASERRRRQTIVVCAYGALIKEPLLSEYDMLNVHPSLLPRWRGAAPIERALMAGDAETGVSIMRLTAGLDSGPVCLAGAEPIRRDDTYGSLAQRLEHLGGELIVEALERKPPFSEQPTDGVTYAEKIAPNDRLLDPARPAIELERVVRALDPHIGARVRLGDGKMLGVHRAAVLDAGTQNGRAPDAAPPAVRENPVAPVGATGLSARDGRLLLDCSPGVLELLVVQPAGGRAMDASAYLRGHAAPGRR
jgi:methionyl-tRNA formyltransferase